MSINNTPIAADTGELSDESLENVAGGVSVAAHTCSGECNCGANVSSFAD